MSCFHRVLTHRWMWDVRVKLYTVICRMCEEVKSTLLNHVEDAPNTAESKTLQAQHRILSMNFDSACGVLFSTLHARHFRAHTRKVLLIMKLNSQLKWCAHRSKFYRTTNIYTAPFSNISAKLIYWNWIHPKRGYERHYEDGSNQCFIHIATPHHIISNGKSDCAQLICVMCIVYERRSSSIICNHANIQSTHTGIGHILC